MDPIALAVPPALREVTATDAPFAGVLRAGNPPTVWVDADVFSNSPAWATDGAEHLLTPLDAAATPDGPVVLLPHCPARLREVLGAGDVAPGALVTLAVSALRGAAEADKLRATAGCWWVTADGRPVLALTGTVGWREDTIAMLRTADAQDHALRRALDSAADAIDDPRLLRVDGEAIENALFAAADPEPIPTERSPEQVVPQRRERVTAPPVGSRGVSGFVNDLLARFVDAGVADRISRAWGSVVDRPRRKGPADGRQGRASASGRRRAVVVAAAVATVVIVVGVLWPSGDADGPAAAITGSVGHTAPPRASASAAETPAVEVAQPDAGSEDEGPQEIVDAARMLLGNLARCDDRPCRAQWWEDPAAAGSIAAADADYAVEVVDEYGGAAAVRIVAPEVTQVLVMVRVEKRWLVREVYDLADQP
ncbi:hypothetical protein [Microbacterium oleivorans]|uniref:hypothetical protein n=1 Tax=Microbacterium oleivorans TaxID=273677 RepID=UPI00203BEE12|nr:hypothetical protein [Microbacterium oleivorans]MCM3696615.1 hypothetical protein [Microbacterium oleivorans]